MGPLMEVSSYLEDLLTLPHLVRNRRVLAEGDEVEVELRDAETRMLLHGTTNSVCELLPCLEITIRFSYSVHQRFCVDILRGSCCEGDMKGGSVKSEPHTELVYLNTLANKFIRHGWSVSYKKLVAVLAEAGSQTIGQGVPRIEQSCLPHRNFKIHSIVPRTSTLIHEPARVSKGSLHRVPGLSPSSVQSATLKTKLRAR